MKLSTKHKTNESQLEQLSVITSIKINYFNKRKDIEIERLGLKSQRSRKGLFSRESEFLTWLDNQPVHRGNVSSTLAIIVYLGPLCIYGITLEDDPRPGCLLDAFDLH